MYALQRKSEQAGGSWAGEETGAGPAGREDLDEARPASLEAVRPERASARSGPAPDAAPVMGHWAEAEPAPPAGADLAEAEAWNRGHVRNVVRFDRATGGAFAKRNGELDAARVAEWQRARGLGATGKVDDETCDAAEGKKGSGPAPGPPPDPRWGPLAVRPQELIIELSRRAYVYGPIIAPDAAMRGAIATRKREWDETYALRREGLAWALKYRDGPYADHPQVKLLEALSRRRAPNPVLVEAPDLDLGVDAPWSDPATADQQIWDYYVAVRTRMEQEGGGPHDRTHLDGSKSELGTGHPW